MARHDPASQPRETVRTRKLLERLLGPVGGGRAELADRLIAEFGSIESLLAAPPARQLRIARDPRVVALLQATRQVMRQVTRTGLDLRPVLPHSRALNDYLMAHLADERDEQVRILYLTAGDHLIADELHAVGTPATAPFCVRTIVARALEAGAMKVIVAHNHPSGMRACSHADVAETRALDQALDALGIELVDHLVVTRSGFASVRAATHRRGRYPSPAAAAPAAAAAR